METFLRTQVFPCTPRLGHWKSPSTVQPAQSREHSLISIFSVSNGNRVSMLQMYSLNVSILWPVSGCICYLVLGVCCCRNRTALFLLCSPGYLPWAFSFLRREFLEALSLRDIKSVKSTTLARTTRCIHTLKWGKFHLSYSCVWTPFSGIFDTSFSDGCTLVSEDPKHSWSGCHVYLEADKLKWKLFSKYSSDKEHGGCLEHVVSG